MKKRDMLAVIRSVESRLELVASELKQLQERVSIDATQNRSEHSDTAAVITRIINRISSPE